MKRERYISLKKTKKGTKLLQIKITYKDDYGQQKTYYENVTVSDYPTEAQAMKAAVVIRDQLIMKLRQGIHIGSAPTIKELFEKMLVLKKFSIKTKERKRSSYRNSNLPDIEHTPIDKVTAAMIQNSLNKYAATHGQKDTGRLLTLWKQLYDTAYMLEVNIPDRTKAVKLPASKVTVKHRDVIISDADFEDFMDALWNYNSNAYMSRQIWYALRIMQYTYLRPAEAFALTRNDVENGYLSISKSIGSTEAETGQIVPTKNEGSVRKIPIPSKLAGVIQTLLVEARHDLLLCKLDGSPLEIDNVSDYIHRVSKKCGIPFNAYRLRHNGANKMVHSGVDQRTAQDILGHASYGMTLNYARSSMEERAEALKKMS